MVQQQAPHPTPSSSLRSPLPPSSLPPPDALFLSPLLLSILFPPLPLTNLYLSPLPRPRSHCLCARYAMHRTALRWGMAGTRRPSQPLPIYQTCCGGRGSFLSTMPWLCCDEMCGADVGCGAARLPRVSGLHRHRRRFCPVPTLSLALSSSTACLILTFLMGQHQPLNPRLSTLSHKHNAKARCILTKRCALLAPDGNAGCWAREQADRADAAPEP